MKYDNSNKFNSGNFRKYLITFAIKIAFSLIIPIISFGFLGYFLSVFMKNKIFLYFFVFSGIILASLICVKMVIREIDGIDKDKSKNLKK